MIERDYMLEETVIRSVGAMMRREESHEAVYITTPIYYINDKPHIGHAYTTIAGDVMARYYRLQNVPVYFVTGTDENSQKNVDAAAKAGESNVQKYLDEMSEIWKAAWEKLEISNDDFIRTTEARHLAAVYQFWQAVEKTGDIYKGNYEGWYCVGCEAFYLESDLIEGNCPTHKKPAQKIVEENYFFRLTKYRAALLEYLELHPDFVQPISRKHEVINYIKDHMTDVSISRMNAKVGIPVPNDDSHKIYVWFDALINYLSVVGYGTDGAQFDKFWPAHLHLVGKDILKFHAALWPAMLMSAGIPLPRHVFAHGHFTIDGEKMSKSIGNVVNPVEVAEIYGNDALRFHVFREIRFGEDGDFSLERLKTRYVTELSNELGNLVYRVLTMAEKYTDSKVPPATDAAFMVNWTEYSAAMRTFKLHEALTVVWDTVRAANKFIDDKKPWALAKTNDESLPHIMYNLIENLRHIGIALIPFMPDTATKILEQLNASTNLATTWAGSLQGTHLQKSEPLFKRLDLA